MRNIGNLLSLSNLEEWVKTICTIISERITKTLESSVNFNIAISGGNTPKLVFEELIKNQYLKNDSWKKVNFFWVDERMVPINHPESNFGNAMRFLSQIPANFFQMYDENIGLEASIVNYCKQLEAVPKKGNFPFFNLMLLGMGDDGHTASLFPNTKGLLENKSFVICNEVPQFNTSRITLTFPVIKNSDELLILINREKVKLLHEIIDYKTNYPIEKLFDGGTNITWLYHN
ncbi:MAG: 6-phosphogluconolactonase [Flavobacteriia bacterium]|nr:6-phosphogluconolactonase [Flavobacteriia bacterium]